MSHNSKTPEGARPFLDKESLKELAKTWKAGAQKFEPTHIGGSNYPVNYFADRIEGNHREDETIEHIHGESFIEKVIPNKLKDLKPGQKLKILDNGAGAALLLIKLERLLMIKSMFILKEFLNESLRLTGGTIYYPS